MKSLVQTILNHVKVAAFVIGIFTSAHGVVVEVSARGDAAKNIQEKIDSCSSGCKILLTDSLYVLNNQIWISDKEILTIVGRSGGTTIKWADSLMAMESDGTPRLFQLTVPSGGHREIYPSGWLRWPASCENKIGGSKDTSQSYRMSNEGFYHNGMFVIKNSSNIAFERVTLDGGKPMMFWNKQIWDCKWDIVHGSVGFTLLDSREIRVMESVVRNFWSAVFISEQNDSCGGSVVFPPPSDIMWSKCGKYGNHLLQGNKFNDNFWVLAGREIEDAGSYFRENLMWNNGNQFEGGSQAILGTNGLSLSSEIGSGGIMNIQGMWPSSHTFSHNSMWKNKITQYNTYHYQGEHNYDANIFNYSNNNPNPKEAATVSSKRMRSNLLIVSGEKKIIQIKSITVSDSKLTDPNGLGINCQNGCVFDIEKPIEAASSWIFPWPGNIYTKSQYDTIALLKSWDSTFAHTITITDVANDSIGSLFPEAAPNESTRGNNYCIACRIHPNSPADSQLYSPDWADAKTHGSFLKNGKSSIPGVVKYSNSSPPASMLSLIPVGNPTWSPSSKILAIPFEKHSELPSFDQLKIRDVRIAAKSNQNFGSVVERDIGYKSINLYLTPQPHVAIELALTAFDPVYQIDLQFDALSQSDTMPVSQVSSIWAPKTKGTFVSSSQRPSRQLGKLLKRSGNGLIEVVGYNSFAPSMRFINAKGVAIDLDIINSNGRSYLNTAGIPSGIWIVAINGEKLVIY